MRTSADTPPWRVALVMTLAAWLAAFAIVTTLLSLFGDRLATLPLAVRALVISGVVVIAMTRLVQPALSAAARRWSAGRHQQRSRPTEKPQDTCSADAARQDSHAPRADAA
jgi:antibiotic biosynthesis monooxygenase (ABM) superfamily enzyme